MGDSLSERRFCEEFSWRELKSLLRSSAVLDLWRLLAQMEGGGGRGWSNLLEATVVMVELDCVLRDGAIKFLTTSGLSGAPPRPALVLFFTTQTMINTRMSTTMMPREMTRTRILVDSSVVPGKGSCLSTVLRGKTLR